MTRCKKFLKFRIILILVFISSFIYVIIANLFSELPIFFAFLYDYIKSGKSIFIPQLPYINILSFLPEGNRSIKFSLGHLIDIFIFINIFTYIDSFFYHYAKITCINKGNQMLFDLNLYLYDLSDYIKRDKQNDEFNSNQSYISYYSSDENLSNFLELLNQEFTLNDIKSYIKSFSIRSRFYKYQINNLTIFQVKKTIKCRPIFPFSYPFSYNDKYIQNSFLLHFLNQIFYTLNLFCLTIFTGNQSFLNNNLRFYEINNEINNNQKTKMEI